MEKITLYAYRNSQPSQFIHWVLLYKKIPFTFKFLDPFKGEFKEPSYLKINPRGKVPSICLGDFSLYESWAIFDYLEAKYPERPLLPGTLEEAAKERCHFSELYCYLFNYGAQFLPTVFFKSKEKWNQKLIEVLQTKILKELEYWNAQFKDKDFLKEPSGLYFALYPMIKSFHRITILYPEEFNWAKSIVFEKTFPHLARLKTSLESREEYPTILEAYGDWEKI